MKVVRTRIVVALASSAVLAGCLGLTAFGLNSMSGTATMLGAAQSASQPCPNTTVADYCTQK